MLERIQARRNRLLTGKANISGANDAHQIQHDGNEALINGALDAFAAERLGLSEDEAFRAQHRRNLSLDGAVGAVFGETGGRPARSELKERRRNRQLNQSQQDDYLAKEFQQENSNVDFDDSGELRGYSSVNNADLEERDQSGLQTTILHRQDGSSQVLADNDAAVQAMFKEKQDDARDYFNPASDEDLTLIKKVKNPAERSMLMEIRDRKIKTGAKRKKANEGKDYADYQQQTSDFYDYAQDKSSSDAGVRGTARDIRLALDRSGYGDTLFPGLGPILDRMKDSGRTGQAETARAKNAASVLVAQDRRRRSGQMTEPEVRAVVMGEMKRRQLGNDVSLGAYPDKPDHSIHLGPNGRPRFEQTDADAAVEGYLANRGRAASGYFSRRDANFDAPTTDGFIASNMRDVQYIHPESMVPAYSQKEMHTTGRPLTVDRARQASQLNAAPLDPSMSPSTQEGLAVTSYVDERTGQPIALNGQSNSPDTNQELNAPKQQPQLSTTGRELIDFVGNNQSQYYTGTATLPQTSISETFDDMRTRAARDFGGLGSDIKSQAGNINDIQTLKDFVKTVLASPKVGGLKLGLSDPKTRKFTVSSNPGLDEVLTKMEYSPNDRTRLANALFQQALAERTGTVRPGPGVTINKLDGGETRVGQTGGEKLEGTSVRKLLRDIPGDVDPESKKPFIGVPEGSSQRSQMLRQMYQGLDATQVRPNLVRRDIKQGKLPSSFPAVSRGSSFQGFGADTSYAKAIREQRRTQVNNEVARIRAERAGHTKGVRGFPEVDARGGRQASAQPPVKDTDAIADQIMKRLGGYRDTVINTVNKMTPTQRIGYGALGAGAGAGVLAGIMGRRGPAEVNEEEYGG